MQYIGLDLGKRASQVCILTAEGELIERRIQTERASLAQLFGQRPQSRILLEAASESEWVARCLEELGHEVVVADPNFAPMYSTRNKRIKTDRRDARALCEACRLGAYRPAHRATDPHRHLRAELSVREALVTTRAKYITLAKSLIGREGWRICGGSAKSFGRRLEQLVLPDELRAEIEPLLALLTVLNEQLEAADEKLEQLVAEDETVRRLTSVPGVGKVTATAFVAVIDEVERFNSAKQVRSYLGLVPREYSSGERQARGRISKAGDKRLRSLLVEVAWGILCKRSQTESAGLRLWAMKIAERRGRKIAAVALARKLASVLYALWRDQTEFSSERADSASREMARAA